MRTTLNGNTILNFLTICPFYQTTTTISQLHDIVRNKVLIFLAKNKPFLETDLITTAEELTSEGVALYLKRLKKKELKLKAPPIGYVFKNCRNTFINQYRKQKKLTTTITDDF